MMDAVTSAAGHSTPVFSSLSSVAHHDNYRDPREEADGEMPLLGESS